MNAIEFIQPDADIRQGDVFMLRETLFAPFNAKHGIAITADCDFANQKHYGRVLFCPLVPLDSYAEEFWSRARLNGIRAKTIDDAREKIARLLDEPAQGPINISARGAEELISNNGAVELFLQTECESKPDKKKAELRQLTKIFATIQSADSEELGQFAALVTVSSIKKNQDEVTCRKSLVQDLREAVLKSIPQDAFLVPDLLCMPASECAVQEPFVVLLRFPFSVPIGALSCTAPEYKRQNLDGLRIGRFSPVIKYAISQQFGMLYARIGLPSTYESNQKLSVEMWDGLK